MRYRTLAKTDLQLSEIGFGVVKHRETIANENAQPASRLAVVLVHFRHAARKVVHQM